MRLGFTFMANFRQRMGREEYWACPSTLCRAASSQSGVQVSSRRAPAPGMYCYSSAWGSFCLSLPASPLAAQKELQQPRRFTLFLCGDAPCSHSISTGCSSWAMSWHPMVSNELFIQFNQKALEPSGIVGERNPAWLLLLFLCGSFLGYPQAPPKLVVLVLGAVVTSTKL